MPAPTDQYFQHTRQFFLAGIFLLAVVFLTPQTVDHTGHWFFAVAWSSSWHNLGDWVASWCSLKMILLGVGGFLLTVAAIEWLATFKYDRLAQVLGLLMVLPIFIFLLGCYYLVKSLL